MSTLFAYDYSGSTGGSEVYHRLSQIIYNAAAAQGPVTILLWDTSCEVVEKERLASINARKHSRGGTSPQCVAEYIRKNDFHGRLVFISDGQVSAHDVDEATKALGNWEFSSVDVHLIFTGGTVNMSVSCPFTRNSPHTVKEYNGSIDANVTVSISPEDLAAIELIRTIATIADYEAASESLEKVVRARTMGTTGDPSLRDSILEMKKRVVAASAKESAKDESVEAMIAAVRGGCTDDALRLAGTVTSDYYAKLNGGWSGSINRLVGMCEGALRGAFDLSGVNAAIQGDRARRAEAAEDVQAADVAQTDAAGAFECPITLETEADVLLLVAAEGEPVLAGLDKAIVNMLADCPLNALNNAEVMARLKAKLDHPISLKSAQEANASGAPITTSPFTRRAIAGGIALGCSREQVKCTTNTIAKMVAEGKLLGNPDMWFAVIWRVIESGAVPHLSHLAEAFRAQMVWRCQHNTTSMSLSGLPELPTTRVPLGIAVWYVFAASALSLGGREEPIRAHMMHIEPLASIVELCGYALPDGVRAHVLRLRTLLGMLSSVKKDRHRLPSIARGLYQSVIAIDGRNVGDAVRELETVPLFVPVDGPASDATVAEVLKAMPSHWRALPAKELYALSTMVDPSLSAGDVSLPYEFGAVADAKWAGAVASVEWKYGVGFERGVARVPICPATCRPYYVVRDGCKWKDASAEHYGFGSEDQLAINRNYGDFVAKYRKYPTYDELIVFSYNRVIKGKSGKTTLPSVAEGLARMVLEECKAVAEANTPEEFRRKYLATVTVEDRLPVEKAV